MWPSKSRRVFIALEASLSVILLSLSAGPVLAENVWRSGHPPTIVSAIFDDQRRLVVQFTAPDGMTFGGFVLIDNDPVNANPAAVTTYGPIMPCNNKGTCRGSWPLPSYAENDTYTFKTEPLSEQKFPAGTYYLQVDTKNEDPYPSTRQEEFSLIATVILKATLSTSSHIVPLLLSVKLPINNGTPLCVAWRDLLVIGNLAVQAQNTYNASMNAKLAKMSTLTPAVEAIYKRTLKQTSDGRAALARNVERANSACGVAPSVVARNGEFVPVPVPASNGTAACKKNRGHIVYVNQELLKIVNNIRTTKLSQTTRVRQLNTRFNQLIADLKKSWPLVLKTCNT